MAYFDNAATTYPKPEVVYESMDKFYRLNGANAGRGSYQQSMSASSLIKHLRESVKSLFHCPNKEVIFTPTDTLALNMIIQGMVVAGVFSVYISPFEHNAVTRTLHHFEKDGRIKITQLAVTKDMNYDFERIQYQFDSVKPDIVIISHASNAFGLVAPIEEIFTLAKKYNAFTVADMAQTAGLIDTNVGLECFDFAVFAGHKTMYGPTGISGFVMKPEIKLPPILFGGTGYDSANQDMPDSLPEKYEMGTLNISGMAGLDAAISWLNEQTLNSLWKVEQEHRRQLIDILSDYSFIKIVGNYPDNKYVGIVSILIDGITSDSAGPLFDKLGIAVRTGLHCAPLAHQFMGTYPTGTIRFSVNYFTSAEDFEALRDALDYIEDNI
jgi:cysteine desulfurase family protein